MKIIGVGDNTVDVYLHQNKMYPGGTPSMYRCFVIVPVRKKRHISAFSATTKRVN